MTQQLTIRKIGGSYGVILPKGMLDDLALQEGDQIYVTSSPEGITITPYSPEFGEVLEDAREFMRSHREAFRELAR